MLFFDRIAAHRSQLLSPAGVGLPRRSSPAGTRFLRVVGVLGLTLLAILMAAPAGQVAPLLSLLLIAPVTEELVFRAGLQEQLLRLGCGSWLALSTTAAVFALLHAITRSKPQALAVFGPALLIGWCYSRQRGRGLERCIALHGAMNLAWWLLAGTAVRHLPTT